MSLYVKSGGLLSIICDGGRIGFAQYGVPTSGAVDSHALALANILCGNQIGEGALEMTVMGPGLTFECDNVFAITGADLGPELNGQPINNGQAYLARTGDKISFRGVKRGMRAYLAVAGGFDLPLVMGSKSTYIRGNFGGYEGRGITAGDRLKFLNPRPDMNLNGRKITPEPNPSGEITLHVIRGPQEEGFTEMGFKTFFSSVFEITPQCDRMGARMSGPKIEHTGDGNMISDGIATGSVQVPADGQPIVMLADHQTTGGYTKIATVISVDIPLLAQSGPGTKCRFEEISVTKAQELLVRRKKSYRDIAAVFKQAEQVTTSRQTTSQQITSPGKNSAGHYLVRVNGKEFDTWVEEV